MDEKFFEHFKKELFNLEERPDRGTWESIEARMAKPKDRKGFFLVLSVAATVIGLMIFLTVKYSGIQGSEKSSALIQNKRPDLNEGFKDATNKTRISDTGITVAGDKDSVLYQNQKGAESFAKNNLTGERSAEILSDGKNNSGVVPKISESGDGINSSNYEGMNDGDHTSAEFQDGSIGNSDDEKNVRSKRNDGPTGVSNPGFQENRPEEIVNDVAKDEAAVGKSLTDSTSIQTMLEKDDDSEKKKSMIRMESLVASAGPSWSYYNFKANSKDEITLVGVEKVAAFSGDRTGFRMNVGAEWNAGPHLSMLTGLVYQNATYHGAFNTAYYSAGTVDYYDNSNVLIVTPAEHREWVQYDQTRREIGGAVNAHYYFSKRLMQHSLGLWLNVNKFQTTETFGTESQIKSEGYNSYLTLSYRIEYPMRRKIYVFAEPLFSYQIGSKDMTTSIFKTTQVSTLSLQFGILFSLNN